VVRRGRDGDVEPRGVEDRVRSRVRRDELDRMLATGRRVTRAASNDESPEELAMRAIANRGMR